MVADILADMLAEYKPVVIGVDRYFFGSGHLSAADLQEYNYDVPSAIDFNRLARDVTAIKLGKPADLPIYDYVTHSTMDEVDHVEPSSIIITEGILLFHSHEMKPLLDYTIFIDARRDERLRRRIGRDMAWRGRTKDDVIRQFNDTVEPAFEKYTAPTRSQADIILDWNIKDFKALQKIADRIKELAT